jgi:hypothetical protein
MDNPVVVVGESYGGVRAQLLLNALRHPEQLESSEGYYRDPELALAIRTHRERVAQRRAAEGLAELEPAAQFSWQVLLQPAIVADYQLAYEKLKGSPIVAAIENRARELEVDLTGSVDRYLFTKTPEEQQAEVARTTETLLARDAFTQLFGRDPASIPGLMAADRAGAKRRATEPLESDWPWGCAVPSDPWRLALGELNTGDCYYMNVNADVTPWVRDTAGRHSEPTGRVFLKNLLHVNTFVTRALLDLAIVADSLPFALQTYIPSPMNQNALASVEGDEAIVEVKTDLETANGEARPGHIEVTYRNLVGSNVRRIRFPTYENAGHQVANSSPRELLEDVRQFLCASGARQPAPE